MTSLPKERVAAWRAFLEAHAAVIGVLETELTAAENLPLTWYDVLIHLSEAPDRRLRMQDLANHVLLSKSGVTRLVHRMEDAGLVTREPCDDDRRGTWAVLTDRGRRRLAEAAPTHVDGVRRHFTDHLDDQQVQVLHDVMTAIATAARGADESAGGP